MMLMAGNMERVFLEHQASCDHVNRQVERQGRYDAEIVPGFEPKWHIVCTHPNAESKAAAYLIARKFGVYLPQYGREEIVRGRKVRRTLNLFPGYLFMFVWDIVRHERRILGSPGVARVMTVGETPIVVSDAVMNSIRAEENKHNPLTFVMDIVVKKKKRRRTKTLIEQRVIPADAGDIVGVSSKSYWSGIENMDDVGRISILHRALGLAS